MKFNENIHHFCTYFDHNYLYQGLAMLESLQEQLPQAKLWILCLSEQCYDSLTKIKLTDVNLITVKDLTDEYPELNVAKSNRSTIEFYFTCSPFLPRYLFKISSELSYITYLDADLYFFDKPHSLIEQAEQHSITMTEHRFASNTEEFNKMFGKYNVAWVTFKNNQTGLDCLKHWSIQCLESCSNETTGNTYGDQIYLDQWPEIYSDILVLKDKGANLAPWNLAQYQLNNASGKITVDTEPLIFFHFSYLKRISNLIYNSGFDRFRLKMSLIVRRKIYEVYLRHLLQLRAKLEHILEIQQILCSSVQDQEERPFRFPLHKLLRRSYEFYLVVRQLLKRYYLLYAFGRTW